jgi:hypothetical protein
MGASRVKFDLKTPCKNCPFGNTKTRIVFSCRERAEEIEESAYRHGFPCHLSADDTSDDDEDGGFVFGETTQHCVGALLMWLKGDGDGNVPFTNLDEDEQDLVRDRLNWDSPVFEGAEAFIEANTERKRKRA